MAGLAIPAIIEGAPIAWGAIAGGAAALGGALGLNHVLQESKRLEQEQTYAPVVVQCYLCDTNADCEKYRKRIENLYKELRDDAHALATNPQNLPYRAEGDVQYPGRSVFGHEETFKEKQGLLRGYLQQFLAKRCGVMRAAVWRWATMPVPKFGQPYFL